MKFEDITIGDELLNFYEFVDDAVEQFTKQNERKTILLSHNHIIYRCVRTESNTWLVTNKYVDSFWAMGEKQ